MYGTLGADGRLSGVVRGLGVVVRLGDFGRFELYDLGGWGGLSCTIGVAGAI